MIKFPAVIAEVNAPVFRSLALSISSAKQGSAAKPHTARIMVMANIFFIKILLRIFERLYATIIQEVSTRGFLIKRHVFGFFS